MGFAALNPSYNYEYHPSALASDCDNVTTELPAGRAEVRFIVAAAMGAIGRQHFRTSI
jgi:hypothetical protein